MRTQPGKTAAWIEINVPTDPVECARCGYSFVVVQIDNEATEAYREKPQYCPRCGEKVEP